MKAVKRNRLMSLGGTLYDAARYDGQRSNSWIAWPMFGEKEFTSYNRETILKKKRMLEANLGVVSSMIKKVGRYSVGSGLFPNPETLDQPWNDQVRQEFIEWGHNASVCDALGRWTFFGDMQKYVAENLFGEGEAFGGLVNSSQVGAPQIQMFDNFEVRYLGGGNGTAPGSLDAGETTIWDGVRLNKNSRIISYTVQTTDGGGFVDVDAANMIHVASFNRPNQVRALSPFHAGANSALDALDLKGLETATIKLHSLLGVVYKKAAGKGVGADGLSGSLTELFQSVTGQDGKEEKQPQSVVGENFFGGAATLHLGSDEDIKLLTSERPSINLIQYLEWLYRDVATSTGLPIEVVWNLSDLGGVNSRICLADAQFLFDYIQQKVARAFCQRVYVWWCAVRMKKGQLPECRDPRWWPCHWQGPAKLNIDRNQVANDVLAVDSGLNTLADYYSARGANWIPKTRQRIIEVKTRLDLCKELGVPYAVAFPSKPGTAAPITGEDFAPNESGAPAPAASN